MQAKPISNVDLLEWFSEDERRVCSDCGERACVGFDEVSVAFCLSCGAVTVDGKTIEICR